MERRTFIKGAFGFAALLAGSGAAALAAQQGMAPSAPKGALLFTTADGIAQTAEGPLMCAGIDLVKYDSGTIVGVIGETELFTVDETGAVLVQLADGTRSIDLIALEASSLVGAPLAAAEVASFFVTLGQAGYLQNTVLVNLVEIPE